MQSLAITAAVLAGVMLIGTPDVAEASGFDRHGYHGKHYRKHHRQHHRNRYRHHSYYWGFGYPGYNVWYPGSSVRVHLDLNDRHRHHRRPEVVTVSSTTSTNTVEPVASRSEMFIYPREGQSAEQRDQDRYECHLWSRDQTGFDPSRTDSDFNLAPDYNRAIAACLEGRGYTVK